MAKLTLIENPKEVDWGRLHRLLHRSFAYMEGRIDPPSSLHRLTTEALAQKAKDETLILARHNGSLVGCMFCRRQTSWLYVGKVAVEQELQGQGIGRQLFRHAFKMAERDGLDGLELETRVELIENHLAFGKLGFKKVGEDAHAGYDRPTSIRMRAPLKTD